jgi:hypothetical protein
LNITLSAPPARAVELFNPDVQMGDIERVASNDLVA